MSAEPTPPLDRGKLARLLGMLGSAHDGEIANAARAAEAMRRQAGLSWHEILAQPPLPPAPHDDDGDADFDVRGAISLCDENRSRLSPWERRFITSIPRGRLSPRQLGCLRGIAGRVAAEVRAAARPPHKRKRRKQRRGAAA